MAIIYHKTAKGSAEIETRAHRLTPRLRGALIVVDGKRTDDELRALMGQHADETLAALAADGFIEVIAIVDSRRGSVPAAAQAPRAPAPTPEALASRRRDAVRQIGDLLGPTGDTLAMKIERSKTADELRALLAQAAPLIGTVCGREKAAEFAARFSDL